MHQETIKEIDIWLNSLDIYFTKKENKDGSICWSIPADAPGKSIWIELTADHSFPFSQIHVYTRPRYEKLKFPHVEKGGKLCLPKFGGSGLERFQMAYRKAYDLISMFQNNDPSLSKDFKEEFYSYWEIFCNLNKDSANKEKWILLDIPQQLSPLSYLYFGRVEGTCLFSTRPDVIQSIWPNCQNVKRGAFIVKVEDIPIPAEYPKSIGALFQYLEKDTLGKTYIDTLKKDLPFEENKIIVCSPNNTLFGFNYPPRCWINPKKRKKGFQDTYTACVAPHFVNRADRNWIFGREQNKDLNNLSDKTVVIIGCGSIGSFIASNLVQAGVRKLILIDNDILSWPNISRHRLGMDSVGGPKATMLKSTLEFSFPNLQIEAIHDNFNNAYNGDYQEKINTASLVISTTADKDTEEYLNHLQINNHISAPVVYGWTTKNCLSGHGIAIINKEDSCLACGFNNNEQQNITPILQDETIFKEAACGAEFAPYGIVELSFVNAMLSQLALDVLLGKLTHNVHRVWIASKDHITTCEGSFNPAWENRYGPIGECGRIINIPLEKRKDCPTCSIKK